MQVLALYTGLRARKKVCRTLVAKERNVSAIFVYILLKILKASVGGVFMASE